ncbi:cytochrome c oxidase subunit I [Rhizobium sp. Leaf262]|uniref:cytochrome c oxidase subunit I n=1 Tax=Rhizobium sp. Leaf262 TaxID=1736312 RepID=UPI000714AF5B|nr:cytochrome c oxidase subunit I [Rhizobium sp. Leaf262]KQO74967.1 cytochrome B [Rhizobium sp. Leaf262]
MTDREKVLPTLSPLALHKQLDAVWRTGKGMQRLAAVNHNVIGIRFMVTALVFFAIGGFLGMLIRTQLATASNAFMDAAQYAQVFTMHGTVMMFLFAIPFFEGLSIYLLPKLLGARDLAFPRLSAYGYWCYLFGGSMLIIALLGGVAPDGGWFMYTPLSSSKFSSGINADVWLLGITFVEISAISAAIEIIVTIIRMRAPGMSLVRMPIFAWYMLVVGGMMLVGFPPLILGSILLEAERAFDLPFFDPERGGDPLLWQHLFWLFGHPEVYIIFLPAAGALSTIIPVLARTRLTGYHIIIASLVAMAFLSFGLWVHHMYTVGIPHVALSFFSAASALVAIPTAIQIFAWFATIAQGRPQLNVPMMHVFGFFFVFVIGGLTGVMLAMVPFDMQAHDTHFVVAHLHYVLVGGFLFPMLAGIYYWIPHISGRQPVQHLSRAAFWMIFTGFNLTFFMMHLTGLLGMPRRTFSYPEASPWEWLNLLSSFGSFIMAMGFMLVALDIVLIFLFGKAFRRNPWKAGTLEWAMPTPPPAYSFASIPEISSRADDLPVDTLGAELAAGKGYLGFSRHGWMETIGVDAISGEANQIILLPKPTYLPLATAIATGGVFVCLLFKFYVAALLFALLTLGIFLAWTRNDAARIDRGPLHASQASSLPLHFESADAPSILAMRLTLVANATLFSSLLFGGLFLWTSTPLGSDVEISASLTKVLPAMAIAAFAAIAGAVGSSRVSRPMPLLAISFAAYGVAACMFLLDLSARPGATAAALDAVAFAVHIYLFVHLSLGAVFSCFCAWRVRNGYVSAVRRNDVMIAKLWHSYCGSVVIIVAGYSYVLSALQSGG